MVDYFSRYPEIHKLSTTTSQCIIEALKSIFSRFGIPETVISDNGPHYSSHEFTEFAKAYDFDHVTSSPLFAQSNGQAERTVQTVKRLHNEYKDPHMALLTYRSTPFPWCNLSRAEFLMGRHLRANIHIMSDQLTPEWSFLDEVWRSNRTFKDCQIRDYDRCHRARALTRVPDDTDVWITSGDQPVSGRVISPASTPRPYAIETPAGQVRQNRQHLNVMPGNNQPTNQIEIPAREPIMTQSQTGTQIHPPNRH